MSTLLHPHDSVDLHSPNKLHHFTLDRRSFVKLFSGGLLVCLTNAPAFAQESGRGGFRGHALPKEVSAWIQIDAEGKVTVFTGKVEVGQNIRTSLAQLTAEELMVPFESITMVMGDTDLVPWDAGTFGSQSTPQMGPRLRTMAATARRTLVDMAAKQWSTDASTLTTADGRVTNPASKQSLTYGQLTHGEKLIATVSADTPLVPAKDWKIAGTAVPKAQGRDFVTGRHQYPSDITLPGMLFGKVLRPAGYNATLDSLDTTAAEKMPGVKLIRDGDFIGVVAPDMYTAEQAVGAIHAKWTVPPQPSNKGIFDYLKNNPESGGRVRRGSETESVAPASIPADAIHLTQSYTVQYIAHAPLEPRAAVAQWQNGKLTVWTGTQRPFGVKDELVAAFHLDPSQVRVLQPDMGAGYGGKHTGDAAVEAARLARSAGAPVKLVWSREEEFTWAYFRPGGLMELRAAVSPEGKLLAWEHHNYNSGPSGLETYYDIVAPVTQYHAAKSPLRQGSYRGLASTANHYARESFMDELAHAVKMNPLAFRQKNLTDARVLAVLNAAAEKFGWSAAQSTPTRGFGIACGTEKGGYVGTCAEVAIDSSTKSVRVVRIVQAWESGAVVNPDGLRNQNMGAVMQGIGGALFESIRFGNGRIENPHFADYRLPRFRDMPQIEIVLVDRKDLPSAGAGEIGLVGVAPAIGNAIFAATGARLRNLPMAPSDPVPGIGPSPLTC
ncbi:MAG TPA: molybdopterin cofactor-binding domain-containing protein [Acidobacteriaceae bacterium]|nr:molybdopterin cofactor-binding domain-containing protein [Acidobacteriaceae bacterium]